MMPNEKWSGQFKARTKKFAVDGIRFCDKLPNRPSFWNVSRQLIKSATSVAANYRSACRAQSKAAFLAKMAIVEEEADEALFWLEILDEMKTRENKELARLLQEAKEVLSIVVTAKKTTKARSDE